MAFDYEINKLVDLNEYQAGYEDLKNLTKQYGVDDHTFNRVYEYVGVKLYSEGQSTRGFEWSIKIRNVDGIVKLSDGSRLSSQEVALVLKAMIELDLVSTGKGS